MALRPINQRLLAFTIRQLAHRQAAASSSLAHVIGNREVVGFGFNGTQSYVDRTDFPMPAIRYKEATPDVQVLREKELGDWKKLTLEEKKALYRASFCQTFSEIEAPTGDWKTILAGALCAASLAVWIYLWMKLYVYSPLPESIGMEMKEAQLKRMIDLRANPIQGVSSHWDYEKGDWK